MIRCPGNCAPLIAPMDKTDTRFESRYGQSTQDRRQKVFTRGALGRLDIENSLKSPLIYSVSSWEPWGFVWRGEAHQSTPVAPGLNPPELPISDEA